MARTVQISGRDKDLSWFECQTKLDTPCCTVEAIAGPAMKLLCARYNFSNPLRSLGIRACNLTDMSDGVQLMFGTDSLRQARLEKIESCVDTLRGRFGRGAVKRASLLYSDITGESDPLTHDVHPVGYFH